MYSLDVERLLDFGVWSNEEMKDNHGWEEKSENRKSYKKKTLVSLYVSVFLYRANELYPMVTASERKSVNPEIWRLPHFSTSPF